MSPTDAPRLHDIHCPDAHGGHRMAWAEWGDATNPRVVVCVHGLTRQGRDFDTLAKALAPHRRVICTDVVGRGRSGWLAEPAGYGLPTYAGDHLHLLKHLHLAQVDWVGTSMGGLIAMALGTVAPQLLGRVVLNDVGPVIEPAALARIGSYVGLPARWASLDEAADALWAISQGFGPHTRDEWLALTRPQLVDDGQGGFKPHYDPRIAEPFKALTAEAAAQGEAMLWQGYEAIKGPVLLLRGEHSDLLSAQTAEAMHARGPRAEVATIAGVGHAPTLVAADQVERVTRFLLAA